MKAKYYFVLIALFFSALMIHSCEKEVTGNTDFPKENSLIKKEASGKEIHVSCEGSCPTEGCGRINNNSFGGFQCGPCSDGCALVVRVYYLSELMETYTGDAASDYITTLMGERDYFEEFLADFILEKYNTDSYHITKAEIVVESQGHGIKYHFHTAGGINETVVFLQGITGPDKGPVYQVDCYGTCSGNCIERWTLTDPPQADCMCESDNCGMEISVEWPE